MLMFLLTKKENLELYLSWFERWIGWNGEHHISEGFDAAIEFQPLSKSMRAFINSTKKVAPKKVITVEKKKKKPAEGGC